MEFKKLLLASVLTLSLASCAGLGGNGDDPNQNVDKDGYTQCSAFPNDVVDAFFNKTTKFPTISKVGDMKYKAYNAGDTYISYGEEEEVEIKFMEFAFTGDQTDNIVNYGFDTEGWTCGLNYLYAMFGITLYEAYDDYLDYYVQFTNDDDDNTIMYIYDYGEVNGHAYEGYDPLDEWPNLDSQYLGLESENEVIPEYPNAEDIYYYEVLEDDGSLYYGSLIFKGQHADDYIALLSDSWVYDEDYECYYYMIDEEWGYEMDFVAQDVLDPIEKEYYTVLAFQPYTAGKTDYLEEPTWAEVQELFAAFNEAKEVSYTLADFSSVTNSIIAATYLVGNPDYYDYFGIGYEGDAADAVKAALEASGATYEDTIVDEWYGDSTDYYILGETIVSVCYYEDYEETDVNVYSKDETYDYFFGEYDYDL